MFRFLNEMFDNNKRDVQRLMKSVVQPVGALEEEMKATEDLAAAFQALKVRVQEGGEKIGRASCRERE